MRLLLPLFIAVPIIEIALLIKVGGIIGLAPTILLVILTAVVGVWLLRQQGVQTWYRLQRRLAMGELPGSELLEGAMLLFGGALLLTPGFMTDTIGFVCLIPALRRPLAQRLVNVLLANAVLRSGARGEPPRSSRTSHVTIEGEYREERDERQ